MGNEPGMVAMPGPQVATVFVAEHPESRWEEIGPNLLHDTVTYKSWQRAGQRSAIDSDASTVDELRESGIFEILTPADAVEHARSTGQLLFHPMCGGIPPALAWRACGWPKPRSCPSSDER